MPGAKKAARPLVSLEGMNRVELLIKLSNWVAASRATMKRVLSCIVIAALLSATLSCYRTEYVLPRNLTGRELGKIKEIVAVTASSQRHTFRTGSVAGPNFIGIRQDGQQVTLPMSQIQQFELKILSQGKTTAFVVGVTVGGLILTAGIIFLIVLVAASCPHIYVHDGKEWVLAAEPNAGAIARSAARDDLSLLPRIIAPRDSIYQLKLTNESSEIDFVDDVRLVVVDHPAGIGVVPDVTGRLLTVGDEVRPLVAKTRSGLDLTTRMDSRGVFFWDGEPQVTYADRSHPREELVLTYPRPSNAPRGRLIFEGYNTRWSDYVMADFLAKFGKSAKERLDALDTNPEGANKVAKFMKDAGAWIEVAVHHGATWRSVGHLRAVGPKVSKVQALEFDVPRDGKATVDVRLRWAPIFWNIMRANADFTKSALATMVTEIAPQRAYSLKQGNVLPHLRASDGTYLRLDRGDEVVLSFAAPPEVPGMERTVLLRSRAYYKLLIDESHGASMLEKMRLVLKRQGIDDYSLERFRELTASTR